MDGIKVDAVLNLVDTHNAVMRQIERIAAAMEAMDPYMEDMPFPVITHVVEIHSAIADARKAAEA